MRKRILAIFLCLILTLSLAAAVAAEDFTVPLPPGSNFLPPNRPEQPEPDDEDRIVTLQIPITKVVELGEILHRSKRLSASMHFPAIRRMAVMKPAARAFGMYRTAQYL